MAATPCILWSTPPKILSIPPRRWATTDSAVWSLFPVDGLTLLQIQDRVLGSAACGDWDVRGHTFSLRGTVHRSRVGRMNGPKPFGHAAVAQLAERWIVDPKVGGSTPPGCTNPPGTQDSCRIRRVASDPPCRSRHSPRCSDPTDSSPAQGRGSVSMIRARLGAPTSTHRPCGEPSRRRPCQ